MRSRKSKTIESWILPKNSNGKMYKKNKSFRDEGLKLMIESKSLEIDLR